jgi:hypothetical protein
MLMKVFWSWQSDTPVDIGRSLVRDALNQAIAELKQPVEMVEEPTTAFTREELHLDHDVYGTTGSPDLAQTIFEKIKSSGVVVADVTNVGRVVHSADTGLIVAQKPLINSNVEVELGYALAALTTNNIILVFNQYFGRHEDLPFDLRHKGGAVTFNLAPGADAQKVALQRAELKVQFVSALRPFLQPTPTTVPSPEQPSTFSSASYFQRNAVLGTLENSDLSYSYDTEQLCYLRVIPIRPIAKPLKTGTLMESAKNVPLLSNAYGNVVVRNEYGALALEPKSYPFHGSSAVHASTQLFPTGEIWAINTRPISSRSEGFTPAHKHPLLGSQIFERSYYYGLEKLLAFAENQLSSSPPWHVELGIAKAVGLYVALPISEFEKFTGPIHSEQVVLRRVLNEPKRESQNSILLEFFEAVYDAAGRHRPEGLYGFPPSPPTDQPLYRPR